MKDLYKILGVSEDAQQDAVKKAYRKLAKENHPDVTGGDKKKTERFKEINEAYGVLGDEKKRKEYDRLRHAPMGTDGMPQGFDPDAFAQVFGGGAGRGGFRPGGFTVTTGGDFDLGELFSSLFGGGAGNPWSRGGDGGRTRGAPRGPDMVGRIEVSFREAALGTRRTIRTGSGTTVDVQVPPGVDTGGRLRVPGQGGRAAQGGAPGDLHLEVMVAADTHLRRNEDDVEMDLPLTVAEASLGTKVDVPTVEGSVRLTVPPGTSSGAKLRLRGKGIRRPDGSRGDQIVLVQIVVPKVGPGDTEIRRLIEELDRHTRVKARDF
jgi:DnaJ-class molecular chaperone